MTSNRSDSMLAGAGFVGRTTELEELQRLYDRAAGGRPRIVFVSGDTGIGKSRLASQFVSAVSARGAVAVQGTAPVVLGEELPYAPIVSLLRDVERKLTPEQLRDSIRPDSELARLLPTLSAELATPLDAFSHLRLFEQFLALLAEIGGYADGAAVVILEDLHWADVSTRDLLAYLLRNLTEGRVLVLVTYRTSGSGQSSPLHRLIMESVRQPSVTHLQLEPLSEVDTAALVRSMAPGTDPEARVGEVVARSGGNPLFATQLAQATDRPELPPSLVNLLHDDVDRLSKPALRLVRLAASFGSSVPAPYLEMAASALGIELLDAFDEIRSHGIVRLEDDGSGARYVFRHPLQQEVVYADITPMERTRLHALVAQVLSRFGPAAGGGGANAIEIARHWWAAGDLGEAYPWLLEAARSAESLFAFAEAHAMYERALAARPAALQREAGQRRPIGYRAPSDAGTDGSAELLQRAAQAASLAGNPARAVELLDASLASVTPEPAMLARRAQYLWEGGRREDALDTYRQAVAASPPDSAGHAAILRSAARTFLLASDFEQAREYATQAVDAARAAGSDNDEREALYTLGAAVAHGGDVGRAIALLDEARAVEARQRRMSRLRPRPSRIVDLLAGYWSRAAILSRAGEAEQSAAEALEGLKRAHDLGIEGGWGGLVGTAAVEELMRLGRWGEARVLLGDMLGREGHAPSAELHAAHAYLLALTGDVAGGMRELSQARELASLQRATEDTRLAVLMAKAGTELARAANQLSEASEALADALAIAGGRIAARDRTELLALSLGVLADRIQLARWLKASAEVAQLEQHAAALDGEVVASIGAVEADDANAELRALAAWARAEYARTVQPASASQWVDLAELWDRRHEPYRAAYARWRGAEIELATRGSREAGRELLVHAHRAAQQLGAEPLRRELESLARRARLSLDSVAAEEAEPVAAPEPGATGRPLGLTAREAEVLALLSEGRTNRQIADALFISDKTAGHHVQNILGKLGVNSRVEAAAIAVRAGLAGGEVPTPGAAAPRTVSPTDAADAAGNRAALTLMFTDMVKSTALVDAIGDEAWSALIGWHDTTMRALFASHSGREIDHAGDGFFVAFADIVGAADCAIAIQRTMAQHRREHGFAPRLRIGVHSTQVNRTQAGLQGRGVHEAARIVAAANGDEILISAQSLAEAGGRYVRLEPRQVDAPGFPEALFVVPIQWQAPGDPRPRPAA